jgi:DNA-directed RNA polymerase subunit F
MGSQLIRASDSFAEYVRKIAKKSGKSITKVTEELAEEKKKGKKKEWFKV